MENLGKLGNNMIDLSFYKGKKVFITGHTGFKGVWLTKILLDAGAIIKGYSLQAEENSLFKKISLDKKIDSVCGDIRDFEKLKTEFENFGAEIVIHMAAQALVRESYKNPQYTYETNVMGTVNILECVRNSNTVKSFINITTDKVYENIENENVIPKAFKEEDKLNGRDPYSNSKSCSELVTSSYKQSFFEETDIAISTVRAGNVIGGGDRAKDRIIPDCVNAAKNNQKIVVRNPYSIRPYQHVLEALMVYLLIAEKQYSNKGYSGNYNVGSSSEDIVMTKDLVNIFCEKWGNGLEWIDVSERKEPYESKCLMLDCSKVKEVFSWNSKWDIEKTVESIVEFEKYDQTKLEECMENQINRFLKEK